jgi:short subunit dehydrogenase-like uncharacterized protein
MSRNWMLYGAYGFTGRLILDEALQRGHRPLLAGRSREKLLPLAERFGLEARQADLNDTHQLHASLETVELILHCAGPYVHTSQPMLDACLRTRSHYLDITGELPVFQHTLSRHDEAQQAGVCLVSGVGFDVVPTDCLAVLLAQQAAQPDHLELAIAGGGGGVSAGTMKSAVGILHLGGLVRRGGQLVQVRMGGLQPGHFAHGKKTIMRATLGDLVTAYASTGIPNITTYMAQNRWMAPFASAFAPFMHAILQNDFIRQYAMTMADRAQGPSQKAQFSQRSHAWGRITSASGSTIEATLDLPEPYRFTALSAVRAVEQVLEQQPAGALTPALAFGADFVTMIPGVDSRF